MEIVCIHMYPKKIFVFLVSFYWGRRETVLKSERSRQGFIYLSQMEKKKHGQQSKPHLTWFAICEVDTQIVLLEFMKFSFPICRNQGQIRSFVHCLRNLQHSPLTEDCQSSSAGGYSSFVIIIIIVWNNLSSLFQQLFFGEEGC